MDRVTTLPRGTAFTATDLQRMPDDGHRYEIIDGTLLVSPAPLVPHQVMVTNLLVLLRAACPSELRVLTAPLDVVLADDTVVQPDLLVARRTDLTRENLPAPPLLAVEILSPSTRLIDLNLKRERYRQAGVPSYWTIDPDQLRLTAWQHQPDHTYAQIADITGNHTWTPTQPYPLTITPARLLD